MKNLYFILFILFCTICTGQSGLNDPSFNTADEGFDNGANFDDYIFACVKQPDGKIIVGGKFTRYKDKQVAAICRLLPDGQPDTTFNASQSMAFKGLVYSLVLQSDGKVLVGANGIHRLNKDGSLDSSFRSGGSGTYLAITIQEDGKILAGGIFSSYNGNKTGNIVRVNTDGSIDSTFDTAEGANSQVRTIAIQNKRIIVGGLFTKFNGSEAKYITALDQQGRIDTSFTPPDISKDVYSMLVQQDSKILISGFFSGTLTSSQQEIIHYRGFMRLNKNGDYDETFKTGAGMAGYACAIIPDGDKLVVGGGFNLYAGRPVNNLIRIYNDGTLDTTYRISKDLSCMVRSLIVEQQHYIIGGTGTTAAPKKYIYRTDKNGICDSSYTPAGTGFNLSVKSLALQKDGKILAGGDFTSYNRIRKNKIVRLQEDGSIDESFNTGKGFNQTVEAIAVEKSGKILAGGRFTEYDGASCYKIIRLLPDGSRDIGFQPSSVKDAVYSIAEQDDGKILLGCYGTKGLRRLNKDGSADSTFNPPDFYESFFGNAVYSIALQKDGNIVAGGAFFKVNGIERNNVVRLHPDGKVDTNFNKGKPNPTQWNCGIDIGTDMPVFSVLISGTGDIYLAGDFTYTGYSRKNRIIRLDKNGKLDHTFNSGIYGTSGAIRTILMTDDGHVISGGEFSQFYSEISPGIAVVNQFGTFEKDFTAGTGFSGPVYTMVRANNRQLLAAGNFSSYNGTGRNRIARINYFPEAPDISESELFSNPRIHAYPNPSSDFINYAIDSDETVDIEITDIYGSLAIKRSAQSPTGSIQLKGLKQGIYFLNIFSGSFKTSGKIVVVE